MTLKQAVHALLMLEGAGIQASISHHGAAKRDYNVEMVDCNGTVDIVTIGRALQPFSRPKRSVRLSPHSAFQSGSLILVC